MVAVGGSPRYSPFTSTTPARRPPSLIAEVVQRRRDWDNQAVAAGEPSMETWHAYDPAWLGRLEDVLRTAQETLTGPSDADPRGALLDVMAVCHALIDQMGEHPATT